MQTAPQLKIKRSPCKGSFDRSSIQQVANIPHNEIADVVDKVELVAGNFKWKKALKFFACIYLLLVLGFIACSVTRAVAGGHRGPRGPWGQNGVVSSGPHQGPHHGGVRGPAGDARGGHHWGMGGGFGRHHKFRMMRHFMKKMARRFHRGFRQGFRGMRHHRFGGSPRNHHGPRHERPNHPREHHNKRAPEGPIPAPVPAPAHDQAQPEVTMIPTDPTNVPTGEVTIQNKPEVAPIAPAAPDHIKDPETPTIVENRAGPILPTPAPSDATNGPTEAPRKPHHKGPSRPDFKEHGPDSQNGPVPPQDVRGQHPPRPEAQGQGVRENKLPHEQPGAQTAEASAPQPPRAGPFGPRGGRHHRRGKAAKLLLLFVIAPLLLLLAFRCKAKKVAKKVKALLEIENRHFAAKYGYVWTVDKKLTELSLTPVNGQPQPAEPQVGQGYHMPYPPMMMVPHYAPQMMPAHQGAPLFTENSPRVAPSSPRQAFGGPRGGYQRVSLDDSTVGYTYK